jgi:hypothetical protein
VGYRCVFVGCFLDDGFMGCFDGLIDVISW